MELSDLRQKFADKAGEQRDRLQALEDGNTRHFRQSDDGPLQDITTEIKAEYQRHIEFYATLITEIDAILGV